MIHPARAGTYNVTYSGGTSVARNQNGVTSIPYAQGTSTSVNATNQSYSGYGGDSGSVTSPSCSGTITVQPIWSDPGSAADPPPQQMIVVETAMAAARATNAPAATVSGSVDDGIGQSQGSLTQGPGQYATVGSALVSGTRYSVKAGGQSPSWTVTPGASATGTPSPDTSDVRYSAALYPVTITLGGATNVNGTMEALTGQQITVSLAGLPSGCTASNYQWTIQSENGGAIIGGYSASQASGATMPPASTTPSVTFYDGFQGSTDTVMISVTATVTFPDNTTGTVSANNQISIVAPTIKGPNCYLVENDNLAAAQYGAQENIDNIQITDPGTFTGGVGCVVQKITSISRVDSRTGGTNYTQQEDPTGSGAWEAIPSPCLDTDFPYPYGSSYTTGNNQFYAGWLVNPQTQGEAYDYPYVNCAPPLVSTDMSMNTNWNSSTASDHFTDWIMYNPAVTAGGAWIPLKKFSWDWSNTATLNTSSGQWSAPDFKGDSGNGSIAPAMDWPMWSAFTPYQSSGRIQMRP